MDDYSMEELLPIVAEFVDKYTSKESTSVPYETAKQIMQAVIYCMDETKKGKNSYLLKTTTQNKSSAREVYQLGYQMVVEKVKKVKELYEMMLNGFQDYHNICLNETFYRGIPGFLSHYDAKFNPQNQILTMDYPTLIDPHSACGVDAIYQYLKYIHIEQRFLGALPKDYIERILMSYHKDHQQLIINVCGIVMRNMIGSMLAGKEFQRMYFTQDDFDSIEFCICDDTHIQLVKRLGILLNVMISQGLKGESEIQTYLQADLDNFATELINAKNHHCLNVLFLV